MQTAVIVKLLAARKISATVESALAPLETAQARGFV